MFIAQDVTNTFISAAAAAAHVYVMTSQMVAGWSCDNGTFLMVQSNHKIKSTPAASLFTAYFPRHLC